MQHELFTKPTRHNVFASARYEHKGEDLLNDLIQIRSHSQEHVNQEKSSDSLGSNCTADEITMSKSRGGDNHKRKVMYPDYENLYIGSAKSSSDIKGIKQWQKPKKPNIYDYTATGDNGYLTHLRALRSVKSSDDLSGLLGRHHNHHSKSANPYIHTHNEILERKRDQSASRRRYRPKSVSEQIRSVLGVRPMSSHQNNMVKSQSEYNFQDPMNRVNRMNKEREMYIKRMQATLGMSSSLRTRNFTRGNMLHSESLWLTLFS